MFKKLLILLLSANLSALGNDNDQSKSILPSTKTIIYGVGGTAMVIGGVFAAPLILPVGTIVFIQTAAATIATKAVATTIVIAKSAVVAAPYATGISLSIVGARVVRPYVISTTEEKLTQFNESEAAELRKVKTKLSTCFIQHTADSQRDNSGCPTACEDIAFIFAILAGQDEFDRIIKTLQ